MKKCKFLMKDKTCFVNDMTDIVHCLGFDKKCKEYESEEYEIEEKKLIEVPCMIAYKVWAKHPESYKISEASKMFYTLGYYDNKEEAIKYLKYYCLAARRKYSDGRQGIEPITIYLKGKNE